MANAVKIVFFFGFEFSRHPEGLSSLGLQSEFSRSAFSRHVRNTFSHGQELVLLGCDKKHVSR